MATDPWAEFEDVGAAPQGGPVYGPAPKAPAPPSLAEMARVDISRDNLKLQQDKFAWEQQKSGAGEGGKKSATEIELEAKAEGTRKRAATIRNAMASVMKLYKSDMQGQPLSRMFGATEYIDALPKNDRFRAAGNAILPLIRPLVAQSAKEGDSDKEMEVFKAYVPSNDDSDITIEQKMQMLDALVVGMAEGKPPSQVEAENALSGGVSYEGPNPANAPAAQPSPAMKPLPEDIDAILAKYGVN